MGKPVLFISALQVFESCGAGESHFSQN